MSTRTPFPHERYLDEFGPALVEYLYDARTGLRGIVVVDNVACGPAIGGIRMAADVTVDEVTRLARAMTLKNAAAGLPHGGGKSGILASAHLAEAKKEAMVRAFARAIARLEAYIPGPDMGTDERTMGWIHDEIGRVVGLPRVFGGIPLDEIGATAWGLAASAAEISEMGLIDLDGARVVIEGFGNVGRPAARFLEERGARLVAASDSRGATYNPAGIPVAELSALKRETGEVSSWSEGQSLTKKEIFAVPHDILIPAARPDSIHEGNVASITARLVLEGANIPATPAAEAALHKRGVIVIPDFIANAGGVICGAVEFRGGTEAQALETIERRVRQNTREVLERSRAGGCSPREAAMELAVERVRRAMELRGTFLR